MKNKKVWLILLILIPIISVAVFFLRHRDAGNNKIVRIGYLPIAASLPLFVASDHNYFKENNIEAKLVAFQSSNQLALAAASGEIDVMVTCSVDAALATSATTKSDLKMFLFNQYVGNTPTDPRKSTDYLIAPKGMNIEGLKGKKIAFFPGSVTRSIAQIVMGKHGLSTDSFSYVEMAPSNWAAALQSGNVDAAHVVEPFASSILASGKYEILIDGFCAEVSPNLTVSGAWFAGRKISMDQEQQILTSFRQSLNFIRSNEAESVKSYKQFTQIQVDPNTRFGLNNWILYDEIPSPVPEAKRFIDILVESQALPEKVKMLNWIYGDASPKNN